MLHIVERQEWEVWVEGGMEKTSQMHLVVMRPVMAVAEVERLLEGARYEAETGSRES
jgi:hypothetical protein